MPASAAASGRCGLAPAFRPVEANFGFCCGFIDRTGNSCYGCHCVGPVGARVPFLWAVRARQRRWEDMSAMLLFALGFFFVILVGGAIALVSGP